MRLNRSSLFVQLVVEDVGANTVVPLPGLGSVTLRQETSSINGQVSSSLTINMMAIEIQEANSYGLPIGTTLEIGHSSSGFKITRPTVLYQGSAYATLALANVGSQLSAGSGMTALVQVGCTGTNQTTKTSHVEDVSLMKLLSAGNGVTTATANSGVTKTTAKIGKISLLNGMITANSVNAVAQMSLVGGKRVSSTTGSGTTGLKVLGISVPLTVAPNTRIDLPGLGYVVVNEQAIPTPTMTTASVAVNGLHIFVTQKNLLNLTVGANVVVGRAVASAFNATAGS